MCNIALMFAKEYDIKFNPNKCQFLCFGSPDNVHLAFDGIGFNPVDKGIHLGHIVCPNVNENIMMDASHTLTRNVDFVLHNFSHCSFDVKF